MSTFTKRITVAADDVYYNGGFYPNDSDVYIGVNGGYIYAGLRFLNITIPKGVTITSAKITHLAYVNKSGACSVTVYGDDVDSAAAFADNVANRPQGKTRTTAAVAWSIPAWTSGELYDSPDLKTIVQEIIDRAGWASGNNMSLMYIEDGLSSDFRRFRAYDNTTTDCALLTIEYSTPSSSIPLVIAKSPSALIRKIGNVTYSLMNKINNIRTK